MPIEQILEDMSFLAIGASVPTVEDAEEFLNLTDEDIAGIQQRYGKLLDKMFESPEFYELLDRQ